MRRALARLGETVGQVLDEIDLSEEALIPRDLRDWPLVALALVLDVGILLTGDHDFL